MDRDAAKALTGEAEVSVGFGFGHLIGSAGGGGVRASGDWSADRAFAAESLESKGFGAWLCSGAAALGALDGATDGEACGFFAAQRGKSVGFSLKRKARAAIGGAARWALGALAAPTLTGDALEVVGEWCEDASCGALWACGGRALDALTACAETSESLVGIALFSRNGAFGTSWFRDAGAAGLFADFAFADIALEGVGFEDNTRSGRALDGWGLRAERRSAAFGEVGGSAPRSGFGDDPLVGGARQRDAHQTLAELAVVPLLLHFECFIIAVAVGDRPRWALNDDAGCALTKAAKVVVGLGLRF